MNVQDQEKQDQRDELLMGKFVTQVTEMFDVKTKEIHDSFCVVVEHHMDQVRVYGDQISTVDKKLDDLIVTIKKYLIDNLEPRVSVLEHVTVN